MSEHVSVETGRALADAGLRREWRVGDWCWLKGHRQPYLVVLTSGAWLQLAGLGAVMPKRAVWLPTAADLLQELAQRRRLVKIVAAHWEWGAKNYGSWLVDVQLRSGYRQMFEHADLAEAAAAALLAVLQEEGQG